ncbi:LytR family transcriptional regulator [Streptacidiphilus pinicola]|uniref:LytR family transcriptional regulator n=1 Tax=Streptacidiphilus pinicola TaxID=2219663 RepID=A0A2X0JIF2_9ACTN|nr:LCP family protein [Streptacidiphilus pinicola]RAG87498.1 LytR family transcriptional regulator [Streptacidiphilus pinicola]
MSDDFDRGFDASVARSRGGGGDTMTDRQPEAATGGGHRRRPGRKRRLLKWTAIALSSTVLLSAAGLYIYVKVLDSNIHSEPLHSGGGPAPSTVAEKPASGGGTPINVLVIGSDSRDTSDDLSLGGSQTSVGGPPHADVEMLIHISADRTNASITSMPRDTWVKPYACQGKQLSHQNITDTLAYGPSCVVDTWESLTHIQIDHFVMLDFGGVVKMADAIGGVQVCTKQNVADYHVYTASDGVHEEGSHLVLPQGFHTIYGVQALEWLRTRHAFEDGTDIGRTHAQHLYLNSMIRKMKSANTLLDPGKLNGLAQAATSALTVDPSLKSIEAMSSLALDFNKVPASRVTTVTIPFDHMTEPGQSDPNNWVPTLNTDSDKVFSMIANDIPLDKGGSGGTSATPSSTPSPSAPPATSAPVDKARVRISVQNASVDGRGKQMTDHLVAAGFTSAVRDTSTVSGATQLSYPAADKAQAEAVAAALDLTPSVLKEDPSVTQLVLRVGSEWPSGYDYRTTLPQQGAMPTTAVTQNAGTDSNQCMDVYAPYVWKGTTPPNVPQPPGYQPYSTP